MTFDDLFQAFYTQYRADTDVPASTDDEYTLGLRLANEAINHWASYDSTYWKELFTTRVESGDGTGTIATGITSYDAPDDMQEMGGSVRVLDSDNKIVERYPLIDPQEVQFRGSNQNYAYVMGDPSNGFVIHLNPAPPSSLNGLTIDYDYYKQPLEFTTGTDVSEMSNPYFIVHRMLANRFRASRNPFYQDALRDAENALGKMKMDNDSGSWTNPWTVMDRSGSNWGS